MIRILSFLSACLWASACMAHTVSAPLLGYVQLCNQKPHLLVCSADKETTADALAHPLTKEVMRAIVAVNRECNQSIRPITDIDKYGVSEVWKADTDSGDCEEYGLCKKAKLLKLGFDASQLLLTAVLDAKNDAHLVLTVRTDGGNFVLDNLRKRVRLIRDMGYTLKKWQSPHNPDSIWIANN